MTTAAITVGTEVTTKHRGAKVAAVVTVVQPNGRLWVRTENGETIWRSVTTVRPLV